ncbi:MAG: hypothetical protein JRH15_10220, partial [Deltaproteobacteria bacterium]|nr:hypothetical protein [Deltaproteobacteria bacterium]
AERAAGIADPDDAWMLTKLEHTIRIYEWMMNRTIEKRGSWRDGAGCFSQQKEIDRLVNRLCDSGHDDESIRKTLAYVIDGGNLNCSVENGNIRWTWADYLTPGPISLPSPTQA